MAAKDDRYNVSPKGKARMARYNASPKGKARMARDNQRKLMDGRSAANCAQYHLNRSEESLQHKLEMQRRSPRRHARNLCRKYGVRLSFYDDLGWYPPDVQEALNGSLQDQSA